MFFYFLNCQGVNIVPEDFVAEQLKSVLSDMQVDVVSQNEGLLQTWLFTRVLSFQSRGKHSDKDLIYFLL